MKNFQRALGLIVCFIGFLSVQNLSAQQYKVEVVLGKLTCNSSTTDPGTSLHGSISVSVVSSDLSQSRLLNGVLTNQQNPDPVFSGVFTDVPRYMFLQTRETVGGGQLCNAGFEEGQEVDITNSFENLGEPRLFYMENDTGSKLELWVTMTKIGLSPGSIGDDQAVCELENPVEIKQKTSASGGSGITYRWEYSESSENGPWNDTQSSRFAMNYTPPRLSQTRWYRRVALLDNREEASNSVKLEVYKKEDQRFRVEFFLLGFECGNTAYRSQLSMLLDFGDVEWGGEGVGPNQTSPFFKYDFDTRPSTFSLSSILTNGAPGGQAQCTGAFLENNLTIPITNDITTSYELTDGTQSLKYAIRVTELPEFTLLAGEIESAGVFERTICEGFGPISLTEKSAPGIENPYYEWQWSIDGGTNWNLAGAKDKNFIAETQERTTWYRRVLYKGCAKGVSNIVKVNVESVDLGISGLDARYELTAPSATLTGAPAGGTFSGLGIGGVGNDEFDPSVAGAGEHIITYTYLSALGCTYTKNVTVVVEIDALCSTAVPLNDNGEFVLDTFSGRVVYKREEDCTPYIEMACVEAQPDAPTIEKVISASAITLADEWNYKPYFESRYETTLANANAFETGETGKWRLENSYVYRSLDVNRDKNYNTGTFDLAAFNWQYEDANQRDKWIPASSIVKYSPNGEALEEYNAIGISSTVKTGYYGALPYLTAQNAQYESVFFESFEMKYDGNLETGAELTGTPGIDEKVGHGGLQSLVLKPFEGISTSVMSKANANGTMMVQFWAKGTPKENFTVDLTSSTNTVITPNEPALEIARSGDWGLYQVMLETTGHDLFKMHIQYKGTSQVWLDDLRVQPIDSEMTCYVYDPATLRLLTVFDGQHFGLYYQYDGEGKLLRKMIETERGIRTVQETFYNSPKVNK